MTISRDTPTYAPSGPDAPPTSRTATPQDLEQAAARPSGPLQAWLAGTGTPAVLPNRAGPCTVIRSGEQVMVVDCGNGTAYQLAKLGIAPEQITHVVITHHHVDHNVDLGFILMTRWVQSGGQVTPPLIVGPPGTRRFVDRVLASQAYDIGVRRPHGYRGGNLETPVLEVEDGFRLPTNDWTMTAFRVDHTPVDQAFGYRFDGSNTSIGISGDTRVCENLITHCQDVDILVHEVIYPGYGIPSYHTLSTDVGKVAAAARARMLALTHILPGHLSDEVFLRDARLDFDGEIRVGQDLMSLV